MPWLTLSQAAQRWLGREEWERRVAHGEAESYVDGLGRRRVWVDEQDPMLGALHGLHDELSRLRAEVERLQSALSAAAARPAGSAGLRRLPPPPLPAPEPAAPGEAAPCERVAALLREVDARWSGSDRELERRAGLPHRFLTKARRGERNGEKAEDSWARLRGFLAACGRAA